ncbi:MAG TPA: TetR/AcrR family transcriptional regulator [Prolixibacteraceae bacterium]|nr:TetR/AcrR family transcriptional regulator [Prolixibacteraceae bacterium]
MNALKMDTQEKIIKVAHEVFVEKGLQGARMQEIADRAGINKALLHYYFRSKDQLFDAVFQKVINEVLPDFAQTIRNVDDVPKLIFSFVSFYNQFFQKNPQFPQFFFHEIWQNPDRIAHVILAEEIHPDRMLQNLRSRLPDVYPSEFLPQHMIANVMGMCLFPHIARPLFQRIFFQNDEKEYNRFLSERTDFLIQMLKGLGETHNPEMDVRPSDDF